jgi:integrase
MGRPALALGTFGTLRFYRTDNGWRVRTLVRDFDGVTRHIERRGRTRNTAERALKEALRDRTHAGANDKITAFTKVRVLGEVWFTELSGNGLSPNTIQLYRDRLDRQVIPSLGGLYVHELTTSVVDRHLRAVGSTHGPGTAKTVRSVLSGMCALAVRHDALKVNPVREIRLASPKLKGAPRALTIAEARQLLAWVTYDHYAVEHDVPDLLGFLVATGCRIGEALGLTWDRLDLAHGTVVIDRQAIRINGQGLRLTPTKTDAGTRALALPSWSLVMLKRRQILNVSSERVGSVDTSPVFPAIRTGGIRDPRNTARDVRRSLEATGFGWASAHVIGRKSLATWMDQSGLSARAAADQLGHRRVSVTTDTYFGRKIANTGAAELLEIIGE